MLKKLLRKLTRVRGKSSKESRLNGRLILRTAILCAVLGGMAYGLRSYFVYRNCDVLHQRATEAAAAKEDGRAIDLYRQYLQLGRAIGRLSVQEQADVLEKIIALQEATARDSRLVVTLIAEEEELLRLDRGRRDVRSRLADRLLLVGRAGDAVAHLELLRKDVPAREQAAIDVRIARCQLLLRQFDLAQQSWGRSLIGAPELPEAYVGLARLWSETTIDPALPESLKSRSASWSGLEARLVDPTPANRFRGLAASAGLLRVMLTEVAEPSGRFAAVRCLLELPEGREVPVRSHQAAAEEVESTFKFLDVNRDSELDGDEQWDSRVPPFADRNADGRVTRDELQTLLETSERLARLDYAESLLTGVTDAAAPARIPLELDLLRSRNLMLQKVDQALPAELQRRIREIAESGLAHAELKPRCEVMLAQLDLDAAVMRSANERLAALQSAEQHARQGLQALPPQTPPLRFSETNAEAYTTRQQLNLALTDALLQRCESLAVTERGPLVAEAEGVIAELAFAGLSSAMIDSLRLHVALLKRDPAATLKVATRLKDQLDQTMQWRRRASSLLVQAFRGLGQPEKAVDVLNALAKSEPLSAAVQYSLAESLIAAGRATEAVPHLQAASNVPGAALRLCSILQRQIAALPPIERAWPALDAALAKARETSAETPELAALELSVRRLKFWSAAALRDRGRAPRLLESEAQQLAESAAAACRQFPKDLTLRMVQLQLTLDRKDLDDGERRLKAEEQLGAIREALGESPQLLLAEVSVKLPEEPAAAREYLQTVERQSEQLSPAGSASVLSALGIWWASREDWAEARRLLGKASTLAPDDNQLRLQFVETLLRQKTVEPGSEIPEGLWSDALAAIGKAEGTQESTVAYLNAWRRLLSLRGESDPDRRKQELAAIRSLIQQVFRWRPTWSAVPRLNGALLRLQGEEAAAIKEWELAFRLGDRSQEVIFAVMRNLADAGRDTELTDMIGQLESEDESLLLGSVGRSASTLVAARQQFGQARELADRVAAQSGEARDQLYAWQLGAAANRGLSNVSDADLQAFVTGPGRSLAEAWLFLLVQRLRRSAGDAAVDETLALAEQHLPTDPPEFKPVILAKMHEAIGRERPGRRVSEWKVAQETYLSAVAAAPDNYAVRVAAVRMSLQFRNPQETAALLQPLREGLAGFLPAQQREIQLLTAQLALRDPGPAGSRLARESLLEAVRLGDRSRLTLQALAVTLERESTPAERTLAASLVEKRAGAEKPADTAAWEPYRSLAVARILALADRWPDAERLYQSLNEDYSTADAKLAYLQQLLRRLDADPLAADVAEKLLQQLEQTAPDAWETARARAAFLQARGQTASAIGLLSRAAQQRLSQPAETVAAEWLNRPDFQAEGERLLELMAADATVQAAWGDVVSALSRSDMNAARRNLLKPQLAEPLTEWRLLTVGDAAGLLERLGGVTEAEHLLREMAPVTARPARILELSTFLLRHRRGTEALDLIEQHWGRFDALIAAASASAISREGKVAPERIVALRSRVVEAADADTDPGRQARLQLIAGDLSQTLEDWEPALAAYARVVELEPNNVVGLNNTAYMTAKTHKESEKSRADIRQAIQLAGEPLPDLLDTLASVLIETGSPEAALRELLQSPETPRRGGLQARLAEAYWQLDQKNEAVAAWNRARKLGWTLEQSHPLDRERHAAIDHTAMAAPPSR